MAKCSKSIVFSNATIDAEEMTIIEYKKDDMFEHDIMEILREWSGKDGLTISIRLDTQRGSTVSA